MDMFVGIVEEFCFQPSLSQLEEERDVDEYNFLAKPSPAISTPETGA